MGELSRQSDIASLRADLAETINVFAEDRLRQAEIGLAGLQTRLARNEQQPIEVGTGAALDILQDQVATFDPDDADAQLAQDLRRDLEDLLVAARRHYA
jgi:hypothetical protein